MSNENIDDFMKRLKSEETRAIYVGTVAFDRKQKISPEYLEKYIPVLEKYQLNYFLNATKERLEEIYSKQKQ